MDDEKLDIELLLKLGKFTYDLRQGVMVLLKEGVLYSQVIDYLEKSVFDNGYLPAFPATVCVNDVTAHFTVFDENFAFKNQDVVKVDFGVSYDGYVTDNAFTCEIGSNKYDKLLKANKDALYSVLKFAKTDIAVKEIGKIVNDIAEQNGFKTIHNLSGHQIKRYDLHAGLNIPNYDNSSNQKIENGMELAIEPFFTTGEPLVKSYGKSNILILLNPLKNTRDIIAKKILLHIRKKYPKLPFSKRWLLDDVCLNFNINEKGFIKKHVLHAVDILKKEGILHEYDMLVSKDGNVTSQFEETIIFYDGKKNIITNPELNEKN